MFYVPKLIVKAFWRYNAKMLDSKLIPTQKCIKYILLLSEICTDIITVNHDSTEPYTSLRNEENLLKQNATYY